MKEKKSVSLATQVEHKVMQLIKDNEIEPGDKLDNEFILAEKLEVSRNTVREAIRGLVSRNVLEIRHGAGTFVSEKRGIPEDPLGLAFAGEDLALDLLDVRLIIEPSMAALAAEKATQEQIDSIEAQCDKVEGLIRAGEDYSREDVIFHKIIAEATGNRVIKNLVPIIHSSVRQMIDLTRNRLKEGTIRYHREVVNAIKNRDSIGAKSSMTAHLSQNRIEAMGWAEKTSQNKEKKQQESEKI
ncbi:MAG: FadR/GntR family transcriptional regulator [Eubacterium sp.]